eukprot:COSAG03_NODE_10035_length_677_cov_0.714533_1_plen_22_part_10
MGWSAISTLTVAAAAQPTLQHN